MGLLAGGVQAIVEGFVSNSDSKEKRNAYVNFISFFLAFLIAMIIMGFVGKLLWNDVVVDLFSFAKPARSVWQVIGLMLFLALVSPK